MLHFGEYRRQSTDVHLWIYFMKLPIYILNRLYSGYEPLKREIERGIILCTWTHTDVMCVLYGQLKRDDACLYICFASEIYATDVIKMATFLQRRLWHVMFVLIAISSHRRKHTACHTLILQTWSHQTVLSFPLCFRRPKLLFFFLLAFSHIRCFFFPPKTLILLLFLSFLLLLEQKTSRQYVL